MLEKIFIAPENMVGSLVIAVWLFGVNQAD
jgi:hypothetical protein